jgi:hypothetical protein
MLYMDQVEVVTNEAAPQIKNPQKEQELSSIRARRTAFVARFIVLREAKRTRAHRLIEMMEWSDVLTAEELADQFRQVFIKNGDNMTPVERDIRRALAHASRALNHFIPEYASRATASFIDALFDYEQPKPGGWRLPRELLKAKAEAKTARK